MSSFNVILPLILAVFMTVQGMAHANDAPPDTTTILVGVPLDVYQDYQHFLADRDPLKITDYSGPHSRRDVVEVVLLQQALATGGITSGIKLVPLPTYSRIVNDIRDGHLAISGTSIWHSDLEKQHDLYHISPPVIENGQFEAGFYTATDNHEALAANTLEKIRTLKAVSNRYWTPDWNTLLSFHLKNVRHVQNWESMVRIVASQRADFLLAPFQQTEGMLLKVGNMTLAPIKGIKIGLIGSRHFAVSKRYPDNDAIADALYKGVVIMKAQGTFQAAYRDSGFFNSKVKDWLMLGAFPKQDTSDDHDLPPQTN